MAYGLILAFVLTIGHFLSEYVCGAFKHYRRRLLNFVAGISLTYLTLSLLPEVYRGAENLDSMSFVFLLIGFMVFYVLEHHAYSHTKTRIIAREIGVFHSGAFFAYHLVIGMVLVSIINERIIPGILFFIPVFLHTVISEVSLNEIHTKLKESFIAKLFLSSSSLLGGIIAFFVPFTAGLTQTLFGFVAGSFLYIVIRDSIPREDSSGLAYFIWGVILYTFLTFLLFVIV